MRVLVIYDTDSDKTSADDLATNEKRNRAIDDAIDSNGDVFRCDPYIEDLAGIVGTGKKDKESKVRSHLASLSGWEAVPDGLKALMAKVALLVKRGS